VGLFAAYWGSLALVDVTGQLLVVSLAALVMWTVVCSIRQRPLVSVGAGAIAWCFLIGFVVNTEGDLTLHTPLDLLWLTVLTGSALAVSGLTHLVRR
jgi:hypothetical protein